MFKSYPYPYYKWILLLSCYLISNSLFAQNSEILSPELIRSFKEDPLFALILVQSVLIVGLIIYSIKRRIRLRDIHAQEMKYQELYIRMRLMFDNAPDLFWTKNLKNEYTFTNRAMCNVLLKATDTNEPIGKTDMFFAERQRKIHPNDPEWHTFGEICRDTDTQVLKAKKKMQFDEYGNVEGKFLFLDVYKAPLYDETGKMVGTVGCGRDITKNKRAEKQLLKSQQSLEDSESKFRSYVESAPDGIIVIDKKGQCIDTNQAASKITGYLRSELLNLKINDLIHPDNQVEFLKEFESLKVKETLYIETRFLNKAQETRHAAIHTIRLSKTHYLGFVKDITQRKQNEIELIEARDNAEKANKAKDEFLAIMSHEMRTPLNPIMGFASLMLSQCDDKTWKNYLQTIIESTERLVELIDNILNFIKLQDNSFSLQLGSFKLKPFITNIFEEISPLANGNEICIRNGNLPKLIPYDPDVHIVSDPIILKQILMNLMTNACKYTHNGSIILRTGMIEESKNNATIRFEVEDTGIGIDPDKIEGIFSPFIQADSSFSRAYDGVGLGLAISKRLTKKLGGKISVESVPGEGSIFWIEIPVEITTEPEKEDEPTSSFQWENVGSQKKWDHPFHILIAEDHKGNQTFIETCIEKLGGSFTSVQNGAQVLDALEEHSYDLILMDLSMPVMDGIKATQQIRAGNNQAQIPIIALSAHHLESVKKEATEAGCNDFITKPIVIEEFSKILTRHLKQPNAN